MKEEYRKKRDQREQLNLQLQMKPFVASPIIASAPVANLFARDEDPVTVAKKEAETHCFHQQLQMCEIKKEIVELEKKQETTEFVRKLQASQKLYVVLSLSDLD